MEEGQDYIAAKPPLREPRPIEGDVAQKRGPRKCLHFWEEEQQAKRACFECFQSSRTSARCDDVTERVTFKEGSPY